MREDVPESGCQAGIVEDIPESGCQAGIMEDIPESDCGRNAAGQDFTAVFWEIQKK